MAATDYSLQSYHPQAFVPDLKDSLVPIFLANLRVDLRTWSLETPPSGSPFVAYILEISAPPSAATPGGYQWTVHRRYNQFSALDKWLAAQVPYAERAPLPGKSLFASKESLAGTRLPILAEYLRILFERSRDLLYVYEVQIFFGLFDQIKALYPSPSTFVPSSSSSSYFPSPGSPTITPTISGSLYVKVIGANNLPMIRSGKLPTTYCQLSIAKSLLQGKAKVPTPLVTESFSASLNPLWNFESFFFVRSFETPVRVQIWESRHLSSNKLLGHTQIEIPRLVPHALYNLAHPLFGPSGPGAVVNLLVQFRPMAVLKQRKVKLPNFRFQISTSDFFPGQIVAGLLILNVGQPIKATSVSVNLVGYEETSWNESVQECYTDANGHPQTRTRTVHHGQTIAILDEKRMVWRTRQNELASGSYIWPFEFCLPPRLPASFESPHAWVRYALKATIHRPGLRLNQRLSQPLRVLAPYVSLSPLPPTYGRAEKLPFRSADQVVSLQAQLGHEISIIGEPTRLTLWIENFTRHRVKDANIRLHRTVVASAHGCTHVTEDVFPVAHLKEGAGNGFPVMPGDARQVIVDIQIPSDAQPSLPSDLSPLIEVSYLLKIECDISGFLTGSSSTQIPLVVSHRLPSAPPVYMPPPQTFVDQTQVESGLQMGLGLPDFPQTAFTPPSTEQVVIPADEESDLKYSNSAPMFQAGPPPVSVFFPSIFQEQGFVQYHAHS